VWICTGEARTQQDGEGHGGAPDLEKRKITPVRNEPSAPNAESVGFVSRADVDTTSCMRPGVQDFLLSSLIAMPHQIFI
jgi:hypothetical protein